MGGSVAGGLALIGLVYYFKFRKSKEGGGRLNPTSDGGRLNPTSGGRPFDLGVDFKNTQVGTLTF